MTEGSGLFHSMFLMCFSSEELFRSIPSSLQKSVGEERKEKGGGEWKGCRKNAKEFR